MLLHECAIRAAPRGLYSVERPLPNPLPAWLPEIYRLRHRTVEVESCVPLHTNRYPAPPSFMGRQAEVREMRDYMQTLPALGGVRPHALQPGDDLLRLAGL